MHTNLFTITIFILFFFSKPSAVFIGDGNWEPIPDVTKPTVVSTGKFAVNEHNKQAHESLKFRRVVKGECQHPIDFGTSYNLTINADDGISGKTYGGYFVIASFTLLLLADAKVVHIKKYDDWRADYLGRVEKVTRVFVRGGRNMMKELLLGESEYLLELTLWEQLAFSYQGKIPVGKIVALMSVQVTEYDGNLQLEFTTVTSIDIDPPIPQLQQIYSRLRNVRGKRAFSREYEDSDLMTITEILSKDPNENNVRKMKIFRLRLRGNDTVSVQTVFNVEKEKPVVQETHPKSSFVSATPASKAIKRQQQVSPDDKVESVKKMKEKHH
ncbi:hypothetical protein SSX86_010155 [Deinandra increscens subsp. villosa]|uniref:Cystatin domain-containing protein n=1 Tax=Deinandra increscens subsp. villosa TaxID=3103831 RepID=A0AAP0DEL4_9ASTR